MTKFYTIICALILTATSYAQAPEKMSYQAIIRNADGDLLSNQVVGMQISILQTTTTGTAVYEETHTPLTNVNGLVTLEIGTGTSVSGDFATIDWGADTYFIKTETDLTGGTSFTITGVSQLLSVPYALHAETAENVINDQVDDADSSITNEIQDISFSGTSLSLSSGSTIDLSSLSSAGNIWTTVSEDYHQIDFTGTSDAQIRGNTTMDLSGNDFGLGNGVFWGSNPGEDTGMFTDGDQLIFISPADNQLVQFWEEDAHQLVAQISATGAYSQISDESLKQNIQVIDNALDKTLNLSGYTYEFKQNKEDAKKGTPVELGMGILAQELKSVAPRLVTQTDQGHYVVNYSGIVPILIEATKEQQNLITNQQAEINKLKSEIEEIKLMLLKK